MTPDNKNNDLSVLIFKDDLASRAFKVPLKWINQIGLLLGALLLLLVIVSIMTLRYKREAQLGNPEIVGELHQEIETLKEENDSLKAKLPPKQIEAQPASEFLAQGSPKLAPYVFMSLPKSSLTLKQAKQAPITLEKLSVQWERDNLVLKFNIIYDSKDGRNQQGRIFLLAEGQKEIFVYPKEALSTLGKTYAVSPLKGEYFSVSRFRGVRASFGPIKKRDSLESAQIFLFDKNGDLLVYQNLDLKKIFAEGESKNAN